MSYKDYQPADNNILSTNNFKLVFSDFPKMEYFIQEFTFPSTTLQTLEQPSRYKSIPIPGNQLTYDALSFTFSVSEDMSNYLEVYDWLVKSGTPNTGKEYQDAKDLRDCTLMVTTNNKNPILNIKFHGAFPTFLSGFQMNTTNTEYVPVTATATFAFASISFDTDI